MTWLAGIDVCKAIGYSRATSAINQHDLKSAVFYPFKTNGGIQRLRILDIEDVVKLIAARNSKRSFLFEEWLYEKSLLKKELIKEGRLAGNDPAVEAVDLLKDLMTRCGFAPGVIELVKTYLATLRIDKFMTRTKEKQAGDFLKKIPFF
jgi:prophage antirepressor-like protein